MHTGTSAGPAAPMPPNASQQSNVPIRPPFSLDYNFLDFELKYGILQVWGWWFRCKTSCFNVDSLSNYSSAKWCFGGRLQTKWYHFKGRRVCVKSVSITSMCALHLTVTLLRSASPCFALNNISCIPIICDSMCVCVWGMRCWHTCVLDERNKVCTHTNTRSERISIILTGKVSQSCRECASILERWNSSCHFVT